MIDVSYSLACCNKSLKQRISEYFWMLESGSFTKTGIEYFVISLPTMSFKIYQTALPLSLASLKHGSAILSSSQSSIIAYFSCFICSELLSITATGPSCASSNSSSSSI